ncbi:MAG: lipopolysaccharide biosynthesis protein [Candidatus Methanoperedens sp.]|nr:lipopolysaccharide biosynthesis protein [Candidatus Methanoperedens nitroreducens]MDJ1421818.1 lipopolysaccharide biosynthesis protein [Candidatus Methanoperedens sp.]
MIAARFYSIEDVGLATALISSLGLVILFSRFGLDFSIIRFLPGSDKSKVFSTCLIVTTVSAFIVGIIYISGISFFSPGLSFIQDSGYAMVFLVFAVMNSVAATTGNAFVAMRRAGHFFFQNVLLASRILLLIPLVFLGSFGIFGSMGLAYLIAALFAFLILSRLIVFDLRVDKQFIKGSFRFSSGNYMSNVLLAVPTLVMPILILNLLGEAEAAKYYIAFAIGNLVLIIPDALSTSLFVEGSHGESLRKNVIRAGLAIYSFLVPAVILIYFFGDFLLGLVGKDYAEASELLRLLALSSFFVAVHSLFVPVQNVRMRVESIVKLNLLRFLLLLGLSYVLILKFGIVGVGYAWMVTYAVLGLGIVVVVKRMGWF